MGKWYSKLFAFVLIGTLFCTCASCGNNMENNNSTDTASHENASTDLSFDANSKAFETARRIYKHDDLNYNSEGKIIIAPDEVLVFFTYMKTFDSKAWQASTIIQVAWATEAIDYKASLGDTGQSLRPSHADSGEHFFTNQFDCGFGIAATETWILPRDEYMAACNALLDAAHETKEKNYWMPSNDESGYHSPSYDRSASFFIRSYLPEQLHLNAEPIHMSTELMQKFFPFLGNG